MKEDRRQEPPNPREPIELSDNDDLHENKAVQLAAADAANQSQQHAAVSPAHSTQVQQLYFSPFQAMWAHRVLLISIHVSLSQTPAYILCDITAST